MWLSELEHRFLENDSGFFLLLHSTIINPKFKKSGMFCRVSLTSIWEHSKSMIFCVVDLSMKTSWKHLSFVKHRVKSFKLSVVILDSWRDFYPYYNRGSKIVLTTRINFCFSQRLVVWVILEFLSLQEYRGNVIYFISVLKILQTNIHFSTKL